MKVVFAESVVISTTQIPDGFFCIRYYDGLEKEWLDLINSSGEFGIWNIDDLKSRILDDIILPCQGVGLGRFLLHLG